MNLISITALVCLVYGIVCCFNGWKKISSDDEYTKWLGDFDIRYGRDMIIVAVVLFIIKILT